MAIDCNDVAKLVMDTKQSVKENQDDKAFHDNWKSMLSQLPEGCVTKMNDLGEKLGCIEKSQIHINCHFFQRCVLVCPMSSTQPFSKLKISTQTVPLMDAPLQVGRTVEATLPTILGCLLATHHHCQHRSCAIWLRSV